MRYFLAALCLFLALLQYADSIGIRPTQSLAVQGKFMCKGKPAKGVKVKIYDHDTFTLDDKMGETKSDAQGFFHVTGKSNEVTRLTPKMNIYHKCGKLLPICYTKFSIGIPKNYLTSGSTPKKTYDAGTFNLDAKMPGQSTDCLN
ncbi:unnamed protein product [Bursaphelenchus xylophilus]|uniref:(pine wood nematode) hypothetical protein n=1 Tax=Bursaphelenchus xylophilus TaxID=6326 RepID=A0A1I7RSJ2_BURXY|nr:unnamed protein product [Bursaphelenchus xylophilus]CAG9122901.1 unnamed protein product [Bursaphelenchus xylophilus]